MSQIPRDFLNEHIKTQKKSNNELYNVPENLTSNCFIGGESKI